MADIGAIRIIFGADVAALQDGIKKASSALEGFSKYAATIAAGVGLERAVERTFDTIIESITHAVDAADKLAKAGAKFGVPAENLQVLAHAAALSDVNLDELGGAIAKLSKNMIAAEGPTSDQAAAFKALGLSVKDLISVRPDEAFLKIADAVSQYADGTTKTAAVQAIFGRGAANLIPILNQGSAGFNELKKRMEETGQILGGATLDSAERLKDTLNDLSDAKDKIIARILGQSGLLDAFTKLAQNLLEAAGSTQKFEDNFGSLVAFLRGSQRDIDNIAAGLEAIKNKTKELGESAVVVDDYGRVISGGIAEIGKAARDGGINIEGFSTAVSDGMRKAAQAASDAAQDAAQDAEAAQKKLVYSPEATKNLEAFTKKLAELHAQTLETSGVFGSQLAPGFLAAAAGLEQTKNQVTLVGAEFGKLGPQAQLLNNEMLKLAGAKLLAETQTPFEQFQVQVAVADQGLQKLGFSAEQIAEINEKAAERAGVSWKNATTEILQNAAAGFAAFAQKNKEFAGVAKGLAIAEATWNTYLAATKAYATYPPPFNVIGAAAAVVAGLGMVAKIEATPYARGGSFRVPGGMSNVDNQLVPLALAPGELVDVTPASQASNTGAGGRVPTINIGVGMSDFITGNNLRDLVEALNAGARDGYKLKVVR